MSRMLKSFTVAITLIVFLIPGVKAAPMFAPGTGDLIINEIMYNPSTTEPDTEWFEVKNVSGTTQNLGGCTITDGEDTHTISSGTISPGQYFVFGYSAIPGVTVNYVYNGGLGNGSNLQFGNGGDSITIACGETTVDTVSYGGSSPWPSSTNGRGISFGVPTGQTNYVTLNDDGNNWKHSTTPIGGGNSDTGTPGAVNEDVLGPNAVTLSHLAVQPASALPLALPLAFGLLALGALVVIRRKK